MNTEQMMKDMGVAILDGIASPAHVVAVIVALVQMGEAKPIESAIPRLRLTLQTIGGTS